MAGQAQRVDPARADTSRDGPRFQELHTSDAAEAEQPASRGEPVDSERADVDPTEERHGSPSRERAGPAARVLDAIAARIPATVRGGTLDPGRRAVGALAVVGAVAAALAGMYLWRSQPEPVTVTPRALATSATPSVPDAGVTAGSAATQSSPSPSPSEVVVDVDGKVDDPGVYTLPADSRVVDAVEAAGGVEDGADTSSVNLARTVVDGEKILVGAPGSPGQPGAASGRAGPGSGDLGAEPALDLNAATAEQLEELPGIGPVLAQRITEYRTEHGGFGSVSELDEVSGIGDPMQIL